MLPLPFLSILPQKQPLGPTPPCATKARLSAFQACPRLRMLVHARLTNGCFLIPASITNKNQPLCPLPGGSATNPHTPRQTFCGGSVSHLRPCLQAASLCPAFCRRLSPAWLSTLGGAAPGWWPSHVAPQSCAHRGAPPPPPPAPLGAGSVRRTTLQCAQRRARRGGWGVSIHALWAHRGGRAPRNRQRYCCSKPSPAADAGSPTKPTPPHACTPVLDTVS